mmetsp:Transcript_16940/g.52527  ORF Transcript_16940/g.52527 Transcript_16940/m.52527 type:complete len:220 (-) Transcript_16940:19-678(-)
MFESTLLPVALSTTVDLSMVGVARRTSASASSSDSSCANKYDLGLSATFRERGSSSYGSTHLGVPPSPSASSASSPTSTTSAWSSSSPSSSATARAITSLSGSLSRTERCDCGRAACCASRATRRLSTARGSPPSPKASMDSPAPSPPCAPPPAAGPPKLAREKTATSDSRGSSKSHAACDTRGPCVPKKRVAEVRQTADASGYGRGARRRRMARAQAR